MVSSLTKRPKGRTIRPLEKFGTKFTAREGHLLPMQIDGINDGVAIEYEMDVASAQVKSGKLLAGIHSVVGYKSFWINSNAWPYRNYDGIFGVWFKTWAYRWYYAYFAQSNKWSS